MVNIRMGVLREVGYRLLFFVAFFVVWFVGSNYLTSGLLPSPSASIEQAYNILFAGEFIENMTITLRRVAVPFVASWIAAIIVGIAMGVSERWEKFLDAGVIIGLTVPGLAWALISVMLFGLSEMSAYFAVFIVVLPLITINFWEGVKDIDMDLMEMGQVFDFGTFTSIRKIILPQLYPYMLSAGRFGLSISWKVVVVVEFLGLGSGVGFQMLSAYNNFNMTGVLAWTALFTVVMLAIEYGGFKMLEKRLLAWRPEVGIRSNSAEA